MIILASKSPRRKEILKKYNINYKVIVSNFDESKIKIKDPIKFTKKLASKKAELVAIKNEDIIVLGSDTIVYYNNLKLGKPKSNEDAYNILKKLNNNTHSVFTAINLTKYSNNKKVIDINYVYESKVTFKDLSDNEIKKYIELYKPFDKAGAYAIQDNYVVLNYKGSLENIMGLPMDLFLKDLKTNHINIYNSII